MARGYTERIQETANFTEGLRGLPPDLVSIELLTEGREVIAAESEQRRAILERHYLLITNPEARELAKKQREETRQLQAERGFSEDVEEWLADYIPSSHDEAGEGYGDDFTDEGGYIYEPRVDLFEGYRDETGAIDWETIKREQTRNERTAVLKKIDTQVAEIDFSISFSEGKGGYEWHDGHTVGAVWDVLQLQKEVGMPVVTDKIYEWLSGIKPSNDNIRSMVTEYLIENAAQGNDRMSFIEAGKQFPTYAKKEYSRPMVPAAKLVELAIGFIKNGKPELDREALNVALTALPYYDRIGLNYPLMCARLGIALQGIETS